MEGNPPAPGPVPEGQARKVQLPDPGTIPAFPTDYRLPFTGRMSCPTVVPSAQQREEMTRRRRNGGLRMGILIAAVAAAIVVAAWFMRNR